MKIEYRTPNGSGSYTTLAEDGDSLAAAISNFRPRKLGGTTQIEPLAGGSAPFIQQRGNHAWEISFLVDRTHATPAAAALFLTTEATIFTVLTNFDLKITQGAQVLYLAGAAHTTFDPAMLSDKSTQIIYAFTGKTFNATAP